MKAYVLQIACIIKYNCTLVYIVAGIFKMKMIVFWEMDRKHNDSDDD